MIKMIRSVKTLVLILFVFTVTVVLVPPATMALAFEAKTDDEGFYTFSNLPAGTYKITAIAYGPPKKIADIFNIERVMLIGETTVRLEEGKNIENADIFLDQSENKDANVTPIVIKKGGKGSISGKVLFHEPFFKKIMPLSSKDGETRVIINGYKED